MNPKPPLNYLIDFWTIKRTTAIAFLEAAKGIRNPTKTGVILFNFHQLTEQICLGLIGVFLNYYPTYFHLNYLFDICSHFTDLISNLFLSKDENEKRVFELLVKNPSQIRKDKPLLLHDTEILTLQNILEKFIEESNLLVNHKISIYKNSVSY
ncbi:hypothetical protein [Flavobacterium lacus]|uniref:HEPN domain-containing protein n=1 Tax=Flavobacterium lacus TaxID=1353778 RepID=A0A328WUH2_9FLAO|nr:hypothetical protein [Flavobacterium lacus]RAR46499.1 hypothetical protein B0I10_11834 [Flavobacterium lacus]